VRLHAREEVVVDIAVRAVLRQNRIHLAWQGIRVFPEDVGEAS